MSKNNPKESEEYYFIGIAGHVMSGIAIALKNQGAKVSGVAVDAYPPSTTRLAEAGISFYQDYQPQHIPPSATVVLANAIEATNSELQQAQALGLPIISFPQLVTHLADQAIRIVVAGTHGKTTTTTLISWLLDQAGQHPNFIIGMSSQNFQTGVRLNHSNVMVIEGDEYSSSAIDSQSKFMYYQPDILVLTSLEWDHPDLFTSYDQVYQRFVKLIDSLSPTTHIVACADDPQVCRLLEKTRQTVTWYGQSSKADYRLVPQQVAESSSFQLHHSSAIQSVNTPLTGLHNMLNAVAAIIVAQLREIEWSSIQAALTSFQGPDRRFELVGQVNQITVIDDYAHHPTEIKVTLEGARQRFVKQWRHGQLWAYYQPHTYSRVNYLLPMYAQAFSAADQVIISPIDPAREANQPASVTSQDIINITKHPSIRLMDNPQQIIDLLTDQLQPGDAIVCMTVANSDRLPQRLVKALEEKWT